MSNFAHPNGSDQHLFAVRMDVKLPADMDPRTKADLLAREKAYSQEWQRSGHWMSIWRCVGEYANLSIFSVDNNTQLHEILWNLPLFPYMTITVTPLADHPSDIKAEESPKSDINSPASGNPST